MLSIILHYIILECIYTDGLICIFLAFLSDGSNGEIEKSPFIAKPVRLTPAWEANNLPNDELNFRGVHCIFSLDLTFNIKI